MRPSYSWRHAWGRGEGGRREVNENGTSGLRGTKTHTPYCCCYRSQTWYREHAMVNHYSLGTQSLREDLLGLLFGLGDAANPRIRREGGQGEKERPGHTRWITPPKALVNNKRRQLPHLATHGAHECDVYALIWALRFDFDLPSSTPPHSPTNTLLQGSEANTCSNINSHRDAMPPLWSSTSRRPL